MTVYVLMHMFMGRLISVKTMTDKISAVDVILDADFGEDVANSLTEDGYYTDDNGTEMWLYETELDDLT